jgi:hypothetical protein
VDLQDVESIEMRADDEISDDELAAIALDADPDVEVGDDAACLWDLIGSEPPGALPQWYMPSPVAGAPSHPRPHSRWRRRVALLVISSFVIIDAYGLCATYGPLVLA